MTDRTIASYKILNRLHQQKEFEAAFALLKRVPTPTRLGDQGVLLRLRILEDAGRTRALAEALRTTPIVPGSPIAVTLLNMRNRYKVPTDYRSVVEDIAGPLDADIGTLLGNLPVDAALTPSLRQWADGLYPLAPREIDRETYARNLAWGRVAELFFAVLRHSRHRAGDDEALIALQRKVADIVQPIDFEPMQAAARQGRSVLSTRLHAGHNMMVDYEVPLPHIFVARNARTSSGSQSSGMILGTKDLAGTDFMRAVKLVRKAPHHITIFPDGPDGEQRQFSLLGRTISLGLGAATLAWHARAATFAVVTRWNGHRLDVRCLEGPVADGGDRNAFEERYHAFCLDCLGAIAAGPPEDIVSRAGIWGRLAGIRPGRLEQVAD